MGGEKKGRYRSVNRTGSIFLAGAKAREKNSSSMSVLGRSIDRSIDESSAATAMQPFSLSLLSFFIRNIIKTMPIMIANITATTATILISTIIGQNLFRRNRRNRHVSSRCCCYSCCCSGF